MQKFPFTDFSSSLFAYLSCCGPKKKLVKNHSIGRNITDIKFRFDQELKYWRFSPVKIKIVGP